MKYTHHFFVKGIVVLFIVGILLFPAPDLFCQDEPIRAQALKSFRITPKKKADYNWIGAAYNPVHNEYLVLFELIDTSSFVQWNSEIWGIIVKAN